MDAYGDDSLGRPNALNRRFGANTAFAFDSIDQLTSLAHDLSGTGQETDDKRPDLQSGFPAFEPGSEATISMPGTAITTSIAATTSTASTSSPRRARAASAMTRAET